MTDPRPFDDVLDPATEQVIAQVPRATAEDVGRAVAGAQSALPAWAQAAPSVRADALERLADAIEQDGETLADLELRDAGKPRAVLHDEAPVWAGTLRACARAARAGDRPLTEDELPGYATLTRHAPIGVVGCVAGPSYPLLSALRAVGPALAAGNPCLLVPSQLTPLSALRLRELAGDILPAGALQLLTGPLDPVATALVEHPGVALVAVTADPADAGALTMLADERGKLLRAERGRKALAVVLDDADVGVVAEGLRLAGYFNSGQDRLAAAHVLAGPQVHDALVEELVAAVASLRTAAPASGEQVEVGPLVSGVRRERVLGLVERAAGRAGVTVEIGGGRPPGAGFFVEPTVVTGVADEDEIVREPTFGPVVTVQRCRNEEHALRVADRLPGAVAASVWTADLPRALRMAGRLPFATVWINDHLPFLGEGPATGADDAQTLLRYTSSRRVVARLS